jgi:hypothetical protein
VFDLAGDRIEPLMDVGDVTAFAGRHRRPLVGRVAEVRRGGVAQGLVEPVAQGHAGAARGGLGPFPDARIDAFITPRYARIHASVRFRFGAPPGASGLPARPKDETIEFDAGRLPLQLDFFALR